MTFRKLRKLGFASISGITVEGIGPTEPGNHYAQDQEPQVGHTGEITVRVGQASKTVETGNGWGSPTVLLSDLMSPMR